MILSRNHVKALGKRFLPFSDAASDAFPLSDLLRLSLFQVSVGMATVLLLGTLNRVMIVELGVPTIIVAVMLALPVLVAPLRPLLGFKSDTYRSSLGWRRIPYLWFGSLWQMGGLAVMPFALIVLGGDQTTGPSWAGEALAATAFIATGLGLHMTQTAGLALAADRANDTTRPRVVALLYVMFLIGMGISAVIIGWLLTDFSQLQLIRVVQGAALATLLINLLALWKQEPLAPTSRSATPAAKPRFRDAWADYAAGGRAGRLLATVFVGTLAFNMQDVLLEPYGGAILGLSVSSTTLLTALWATGALFGFAVSAHWLGRGQDPIRLAARGVLIGIASFSALVFSAPMQAPSVFFVGVCGIGLGAGLFAVATLTSAMTLPKRGLTGQGLALGAWGAAQATAAGLAILAGGGLKDVIGSMAQAGTFGATLNTPSIGYAFVYHIEILLLFATLILLAPLVRLSFKRPIKAGTHPDKLGLAEFPS
ncbi:PucC family protein [Phaeobacter sp.]|uniref:PucC family protein n=1 Tax=Phaeobacter sp. TaxID=1902409 RepID=UPI0025CB7D98|nr:PucC family protein [Phaeobacter sp.]